jgi:hypothetical protein
VLDLDGQGHDVAGAPARASGFDFDGRRATWTASGCGFVSVLVDPDVDSVDPPRGEPAPPPCTPPRIQGIGLGSGEAVVVKVVCRRGCRGRLRADADAALGATAPLAVRSLDLRASTRVRRITLMPSAADRRRLAARPRQLRLQALFDGRDGRGRRVATTRAGSVKRP